MVIAIIKLKVRHKDVKKQDLHSIMPKVKKEDILFVCIGTDRSTGDALGPIVGTKLKRKGYNVFGTMHEPVHAMNLEEYIKKIPKDKLVIAVDACLGQMASVGHIQVSDDPMCPGAGVKLKLPKVGDWSIAGIVNVGGFMEYFVLQNTRLSLVMDMATNIVGMIDKVYGVKKSKEADKCLLSI